MGEIRIVRSEHLKFSRPIESERAEMLRVFRKQLGSEARSVPEEAVIVTLTEGRERWHGDRKIEWKDRYTKDHLHIDIQKFKDLIDAKKARGLEITVKDAVMAYVLVWGYGRKSTIAGFLWAMADDYPEFRMKHEETRQKVKIRPLFGEEKEEERITRVMRPIEAVDEFVSTVGQALSRLRSEGVVLG